MSYSSPIVKKLRREIEKLKLTLQDVRRNANQWEKRCGQMEYAEGKRVELERMTEEARTSEIFFMRDLIKMLTVDPKKRAIYERERMRREQNGIGF